MGEPCGFLVGLSVELRQEVQQRVPDRTGAARFCTHAAGLRLWIAKVFFSSGLTKIADWGSTVFLFQFEYQVPILPAAWTAGLATTFELVMPVLLVIGLATRSAALPLLAMTLVIQLVLGATNPAYDHITHYYWMILLITIIVRGPGPLSVDHLIVRKLRP